MKSGRKTFDVRIADFEAREGDVLVFEEFDPEKNQYTGRTIEKRISFLMNTKKAGFYPEKQVQEYGFYIFQLE